MFFIDIVQNRSQHGMILKMFSGYCTKCIAMYRKMESLLVMSMLYLISGDIVHIVQQCILTLLYFDDLQAMLGTR